VELWDGYEIRREGKARREDGEAGGLRPASEGGMGVTRTTDAARRASQCDVRYHGAFMVHGALFQTSLSS
jgi:hypothetical protein